MTGLQEVPTDELLSFQDFPPVHNPSNFSYSTNTTIPITDLTTEGTKDFGNDLPKGGGDISDPLEENTGTTTKSFWTLDYYQQFFDVDTAEVIERLLASIVPRTSVLHNKIKLKPDLYGPFWVSVTLIFTIAISGNVVNYLQQADAVHYHWKYDFHLVSYAATAIMLYISVVPLLFWGLLKWSTEIVDLDSPDLTVASPLELICVYGYSLFIYIPVSMLWTIQIGWFQWLLVLIAASLSGSVLVFALLPVLRLSRHKFPLMFGVMCCHLVLAAGFMLYFFHVPNSPVVSVPFTTVAPVHQNKSAS